MKRILPILILLLLIGGMGFLIIKNQPVGQGTPSTNDSLQKPGNQTDLKPTGQEKTMPAMTIDKTKKYQAIIKTTDGDMTIDLYADKTPITVNNFVTLAKNNFYNNTIFHRIIKGFMIQGGDPTGTGTGGPGYQFDDEPITDDYTRGTIAMANSGPNTNGSQFFIMHQDYNLPKNYVIFGKLSSGLDTLDKLAETEVTSSPNGENSQPVKAPIINSIEIIEQ